MTFGEFEDGTRRDIGKFLRVCGSVNDDVVRGFLEKETRKTRGVLTAWVLDDLENQFSWNLKGISTWSGPIWVEGAVSLSSGSIVIDIQHDKHKSGSG